MNLNQTTPLHDRLMSMSLTLTRQHRLPPWYRWLGRSFSSFPSVNDTAVVSDIPQSQSTQSLVIDTEDYLIAHTDSLALVYNRYNPAIIRAFKDAKAVKSTNEDFLKVLRITEDALIIINKKLERKPNVGSFNFSYMPLGVSNARNKVEKILSHSMKAVSNYEELKGIAAAMQILLPQSPRLWQDFDRLVHSKLRHYGLDFALLAAYSVQEAAKGLRLDRSKIRTPTAALQLLLDHRSETTKNIFDAFTTSQQGFEVLAPIGATQVRDDRSVELLGLQLHLVASQDSFQHHSQANQLYRKRLLEDLTLHCVRILSSLHAPVKLSLLRQIWELAPKIDLPDSYMLYKTLYQQVMYSITTEPLQIVQQEDALCSLFESMIESQFKSSQLLLKLQELIQIRGLDCHRVGVRLFNALVRLEALSFSTIVLENIMKYSSMKLESIFSQSSREKVFSLSDAAKGIFLKLLYERSRLAASCGGDKMDRSSSTNLMLALLYFSREDKRSPHYKLLEQLEYTLSSKLSLLSSEEALMIMHSYALAGRLQPSMMRGIDQHCAQHIQKMNSRQLSTVIWACGRLNHQPVYLSEAIEKYFLGFEGVSKLSAAGYYPLSRTLWSLAAMQRLTPSLYLTAHRLLMHSMSETYGVEINSWISRQLMQVILELKILLPPAPSPIGKHSNSMGVQFQQDKDQLATAIGQLDDMIRSSKSWKYLQRRLKDENNSSQTHLDASAILRELGIVHENEKILDNGYYADIYISPQFAGNTTPSNSKGIVVEFDGPWHFESYLDVSAFRVGLKLCSCDALGDRDHWVRP